MVVITEVASDDGEEEPLYTCAACGSQIPERRREAHDTMWCPMARDADDDSGDEVAPSDERKRAARHAAAKGARQEGSFEGSQRRCPHGFNPHACIQCLDGEDEDSDTPECYDGRECENLEATPETVRRQSMLSLFFLFLIVGPTCAAGFMYLQDFMDPWVLSVGEKDTKTVGKIFFGGGSCVVHCVKPRTAGKNVKMLTEAAEILRSSKIRVAEVHCWTPLQTSKGPRTLAKRFHFRDKPPVTMFVKDGSKPMLLNSDSLTAPALVKQVHRLGGSGSRDSVFSERDAGSSKHRKAAGGRRESVGRRPEEEADTNTAHDDTQPSAEEETVDLDGL